MPNTQTTDAILWEVRLALPPREDFANLALDACWSVTGNLHLDDRYRRRLQQALREVFLGSVRRAVPPADKLPIAIVFRATTTRLELLVHEHGMPFGDEGSLEAGLIDVQGLVDKVMVSNHGRDGTTIALSTLLQRKTLEQYLSRSEWNSVRSASERAAGEKKKVPFEVRVMRDDEAIEICRCAFLSYGYSYLHDTIYYPDRIREMNRTGDLVSSLCVARKSGEIMGHTALRPERGNGVGELMMAFVKPEFRGNGCLEAMTEALLVEARQRRLAGAFVCAVTTHAYSQKAARKHGFSECALMLSRIGALSFQGFDENRARREALVTCFQLFEPIPSQVMHMPPRHADIICRIMAGLGIVARVAETESPRLASQTELEVETDHQLTGHIRIRRFGPNVRADVNKALRSLCIRRMETIYLHLPLGDVGTALFTPLFETMHFFFCGVAPSPTGNHHLVLQFLNNQINDYESIKMDSPLGNDLLAYVRAQDPFHDFPPSLPT